MRSRSTARRGPDPGGPSPTCRALVVDDHVDSAEMLALALQASGIHVDVAHDGDAALAALEGGTHDVVLLDLTLPGGLDGYETARRIRATRRSSCPVLIAVTGWTGAEIGDRAAEAGFDRHMVKPIDPDEILALVQRACTSEERTLRAR